MTTNYVLALVPIAVALVLLCVQAAYYAGRRAHVAGKFDATEGWGVIAFLLLFAAAVAIYETIAIAVRA